ncbi:putative reverse transcriptase domain-containing protein [Tanacetum coccineum]
MPPRKAPRTRTTPATTTNTTSVTNAQLHAMIDQGVVAALATRDANRSTNGEDSHNSGIGVRRNERVARETVGHDVAYAMTDLKKKMTDKYCPRSKIKKLEVELWNLKVKGTDVLGYNQRFQELALLCVRMFSEESDKIEKYVGGLPDMIHGSVMASRPKTMHDAIEMATELMDKKISTLAERQAENKRKLDNNNQAQQQSPKRQNVAQAYVTGTSERKEYDGLFHCATGHYRSDCLELKNQNYGNQAEGTGARGLVHALRGESDKDLNDMEDDIKEVCFGKWGKLNPRYVGPSKVMEKVGSVAYKLEFPQELSKVHNTFHISNLKKCYSDKPLAVLLDGLHFDDKLQFVEEPVEIMDREVKRLKRSRISLVKVLMELQERS